MKQENIKKILVIILILSVIGLITSIYLVKNHYENATGGSFCDFGETISCSLVNTSVYSELFNVPVALFGSIWFFILILIVWRELKKPSKREVLMLAWSIFGFLFIIYMIIAEFILKAICPLCTLVHIIVLIILILTIALYKNEKVKITSKVFRKIAMPWIFLILIFNLIPLIFLNLPSGKEKENYDVLAQCLTEKGVNMYSSFRCSVCARTKEMFGDCFK